MNAFEKVLLALVTTAAETGTIFVHSAGGIAIFGASETLLSNLITAFSPVPAVPSSATVVPITTGVTN